MSDDQQQNQPPAEKRELSIQETLSRPAEEFINDESVEVAWLTTAVRHMEAYYKLISSVKEPASLRLTPNDDLIYQAFQAAFPALNVEQLTEEAIKSAEEKVKWRNFCNEMEAAVADFNFATMMRLNSRLGYSEENSIVVPRAQFIAIEIARNRRGFNDNLPPPPTSED